MEAVAYSSCVTSYLTLGYGLSESPVYPFVASNTIAGDYESMGPGNRIDELSHWTRALSDSEISYLYNANPTEIPVYPFIVQTSIDTDSFLVYEDAIINLTIRSPIAVNKTEVHINGNIYSSEFTPNRKAYTSVNLNTSLAIGNYSWYAIAYMVDGSNYTTSNYTLVIINPSLNYSDGLIAYYTMNELSRTGYTNNLDSVGGNHLNTTSTQLSYGKINYARTLGTTTFEVYNSSTAGVNGTYDPSGYGDLGMSISSWVLSPTSTSVGTHAPIVWMGSDTYTSFHFRYNFGLVLINGTSTNNDAKVCAIW